MEQTVGYLQRNLERFLRNDDPVLICFDDDGGLGTLFYQAAVNCGAKPIFWGPDIRWITLLRQTFDLRACTLIAPPLVILGLTKLARAKGTPLYVRNVVTAGYPCTDWMIEGIRNGLDCKTWGCFDVQHPSVVAGFSCGKSLGVHLNTEAFSLELRDDHGQPVCHGELGNVYLTSLSDGTVVRTLERARLDARPCKCGSAAPRLMDIGLTPQWDSELIALSGSINRWTSVLDSKVARGPAGLEIEIVVFPGEKLPKLPSCAKLVIRPWEPEVDAPFWYDLTWKNGNISGENH